ncbi:MULTISPECIES: hypothetical protein [unclassified Imperialibacter]|nr:MULTISPECIES: hypothetical protein [unclassified Imperialibacter]
MADPRDFQPGSALGIVNGIFREKKKYFQAVKESELKKTGA